MSIHCDGCGENCYLDYIECRGQGATFRGHLCEQCFKTITSSDRLAEKRLAKVQESLKRLEDLPMPSMNKKSAFQSF